MDYRIIKADDVALGMMANKLMLQRALTHSQRLTTAIENRGKKLNETTTAENLLLSRKEQSDNATLANMSLQDQVNFSTVTLSLYQRETLQQVVIANDKTPNAYTPGLGKRILVAFKTGWEMLAILIVFMTQLWWIIIPVVAGLFLVRKYAPGVKSK
jgi:hypothetical protein